MQSPIPRKSYKTLDEANVSYKKKLKELESNLNSKANFNEYTKCKRGFEHIYERIAEGTKIRSKCQWYEEGEKRCSEKRCSEKKK